MRWVETLERVSGINTYRILVGESEEKQDAAIVP